MKTKRQVKSDKLGKWLDTVIEPVSIIEDYSKLIGTGISFHKFVFKKGVIMLSYAITPELCKQFPIQDQHKYDIDLSGVKAFTFRVVNGMSDSPVLNPEFCKLMEDHGKDVVNGVFRGVSDWVNKKQKEFKVIHKN